MRSLVQSALDAHQGTITVDDHDEPTIALLTVGRFIAVGGDPSHPALGDLLRQQPTFWIIAENEAWQQTIHRNLGSQIEWRDRIRFEADTLSLDYLAQYLSTPQGYLIEPIHQETMPQFTRPDGSTGAFPNANAFLKRGLGYCALYDGQAVGFALSYATHNSGIEIDLWIHEAHRRQGLATTVSAHLITTCLNRGLEPHWDAANDESAALAEKLGYRRIEHYRMLRRPQPNEVP